MKKIIIPIILIFVFCINLSAQEKSRKEKRGDKYFYVYSFDKAIKKYTSVEQLTIEGQRKLAESYHSLGNNKAAESIYSNLINNYSSQVAEDYYNYAMVLKMNGKYSESDKWMNSFSIMKPDDLRSKNYQNQKHLLSEMMNDNGTFKISYLQFNTKEQEFAASYYEEKIVFVSSRTKRSFIVRKDNWTGNSFLDMYVADVKNGEFENIKQFDRKLNRKRHDGPASFSNNYQNMAFTRNDYKSKCRDKVVNLQIFFSNYSNEKWLKPEPFYLNSKNYSVGHACLLSDGSTMYFASDMPGGFGGVDLYKISKNEKGVWGNPENLGAMINTEGDELFPFYDETNNILFFSSDGLFGLGGLDVFYCYASNGKFGTPVNAGSPMNSQYNDYAAIVDDKLQNGYFSSDREGTDNIYSMDILKSIHFINPDVNFLVNSPENIKIVRSIKETFPIRNYVFFDLESTEIPERYILLTKEQAKEFQINNLEMYVQKDFSGRSKRQLIVYYNILNILGNRMTISPLATITLVGSSEKGPEDGILMAKSVQEYLVNVFGIEKSRIAIEGRHKPKIPSEQLNSVNDLELKKQGDRRVTIESNSPQLIMEFHSGPEAPLKPLEIVVQPEVPFESYVSIHMEGAMDVLKDWSMEITDDQGEMQSFGVYTHEFVSIPGQTILGDRDKGMFNVKMIGNLENGLQIEKDTTVNIVLWKTSDAVEGMRFSILYEFDESESILMYHKYIKEVIVPLIPFGATVVIHGHTDVIGDDTYNAVLSMNRAKDVKTIIEKSLAVKRTQRCDSS
jgi:tetratricopeptide (TPR) repeat protein